MKPGLAHIVYWVATDEDRRLLFAADRDRIKSYAWGPVSGPNYTRTLPTHTMNTKKYGGPLAVLPGGRLIRAGKGAVGVWNLDNVRTHGADGTKRIGKIYDSEDSWRDDPEEIEESSGCLPGSSVKLEDTKMYPGIWAKHPSKSGVMICAADPKETELYSTVAIDLEGGGKSVGKYTGHGGELSANGIVVSATPDGDRNVFVTACMDGLARLYDVRQPLPVLTMDSGGRREGCPAAVLIHPDGIPSTSDFFVHCSLLPSPKFLAHMLWFDIQSCSRVAKLKNRSRCGTSAHGRQCTSCRQGITLSREWRGMPNIIRCMQRQNVVIWIGWEIGWHIDGRRFRWTGRNLGIRIRMLLKMTMRKMATMMTMTTTMMMMTTTTMMGSAGRRMHITAKTFSSTCLMQGSITSVSPFPVC